MTMGWWHLHPNNGKDSKVGFKKQLSHHSLLQPSPCVPSPEYSFPRILSCQQKDHSLACSWGISQYQSPGAMKGRVTEVARQRHPESQRNVFIVQKEKMKSGKASLPDNKSNSFQRDVNFCSFWQWITYSEGWETSAFVIQRFRASPRAPVSSWAPTHAPGANWLRATSPS